MQSYNKTLSFVFLLSILTLPYTFAQIKADQISELMNKYSEYDQFNGSVLVAQEGKVVFKKGFGMANMEWDIPNASNTKHRIGSITKQFTSMLIMQLVEQGKLDLTVPISTYLPDYPKAVADKVNLHHLLTHTSGIPNYTSFPSFFKDLSRNPYTPEEFIKVFADSTLNFEPGAKFSYSNSGYFVLGLIIEKTTGKSYEAVLQEYIFDPLEMTSSGFDHHSEVIKNRATGYARTMDGFLNSGYIDMSLPYAAGSMYSSVEDLHKWDQALYANKLLSAKNTALLFKKYIPSWGGHYGYGWEMSNMAMGQSTDSTAAIAHSGGVPGFNALITRFPKKKCLVVLLSNAGGAPLNDMTNSISGILFDKGYELPKRSLARLLFNTIKTDGLKKGLSTFEKFKGNKEYALNEGEMNSYGYALLREEKLKEAIAVFKLNVASYPESGNVYDSLGEAYLLDGQKELGKKNYEKSVAIDPSNENGKAILKKLEEK